MIFKKIILVFIACFLAINASCQTRIIIDPFKFTAEDGTVRWHGFSFNVGASCDASSQYVSYYGIRISYVLFPDSSYVAVMSFAKGAEHDMDYVLNSPTLLSLGMTRPVERDPGFIANDYIHRAKDSIGVFAIIKKYIVYFSREEMIYGVCKPLLESIR